MLKVLVSTRVTQGRRKNDFCWVPDGELVMLTIECDGERIDGSCGCRRSMTGVDGRRATTTFMVVERDMTTDEYADLILAGYVAGLWTSPDDPDYAEWKQTVREGVEVLLEITNAFPIGSVLEKRGDTLRLRTVVAEPA